MGMRRIRSQKNAKIVNKWQGPWMGGTGRTVLYRLSPTTSAKVRARRLHINRVQRLARHHKQPIALLPSETKVGANFGQQNHSDPLAIRCEDVNSIVPFTCPASRRPKVAIHITTNPI